MQSRYSCSGCQGDFNEGGQLPQILSCNNDLCKKCCFNQFLQTQKITCPQCTAESYDFLNLQVNNALSQEIKMKKQNPYAIPPICQNYQQQKTYYCEQESTTICEKNIPEGNHQGHRIHRIDEVSNNLIGQVRQELEQVKLSKINIEESYQNSYLIRELTINKFKDFVLYIKGFVQEKVCYIVKQGIVYENAFQNTANKLIEQIDQKQKSWETICEVVENQHYQIPNNPHQLIDLRQNKLTQQNGTYQKSKNKR